MMKRFAIFLICLLIAGCSFSQEPAPTSVDIPTPVPMNITIYHGNENADGFESEIYEVFYFNSTTLIEKLIEAEVLTQEVSFCRKNMTAAVCILISIMLFVICFAPWVLPVSIL